MNSRVVGSGGITELEESLEALHKLMMVSRTTNSRCQSRKPKPTGKQHVVRVCYMFTVLRGDMERGGAWSGDGLKKERRKLGSDNFHYCTSLFFM